MMNRYQGIGSLLFLIGCVFLGLGIVQGQISFGLVVFIPFIIGSGLYATLGFILLFLGIILYYYGYIKGMEPYHFESNELLDHDKDGTHEKSFRSGGIILFGPIPIVFGSTKKMALSLLIISVLFIIFYWFILPILLTIP